MSNNNKPTLKVQALVAWVAVSGLACCAALAQAQALSKEEYQVASKAIAADYDTAKNGCDSFSGNTRDICMAEAKGKRAVAKADLELRHQPSAKHRYELSLARAEADYGVWMQKCDDRAGNDKDVCVKEAKAARVHAEADAKARLKTNDANQVAVEKTTDANVKAMDKITEARKDAAADKREADFAVAKVKCDVLAGSAKDLCLGDAKARYGMR